ncbi:MAG: NfeD family protein [Hoylesella marshii]|uniref:NfeD family protein n=1 Tax=Hoylesella marshii TaxID=189722 RepID=UPI003F9FA657
MIEYFTQHFWLFWLLTAILCLILEVSSGTFYIMCLAIGAVCAAFAGMVTDSVYVQVVIFALSSLVSIFLVRPFAMRYLHRAKGDKVSNADALMGRVGTVSEAIVGGGFGRVAIDGDDWKAVSADGAAIALGEKVKVTGRESIIITVKRVE